MAGNKLTDAKVRSLKYDETCGKACRMYADGGGLSLKLTKSGGKLWIVSYRFEGRQVHFHIGTYPTLTLSMAREKLLECKRLLEQGINPADKRREEKQAVKEEELADKITFGFVFDEWLKHQLLRESTKATYLKLINKDIMPELKDKSISKLSKQVLASAIKKTYERTASRGSAVAIILRQVFRYAEDYGYIKFNPIESIPRIFPYNSNKHRKAIIDKDGITDMLRKIENYCDGENISIQVSVILRLLPVFGMRITALCSLEWTDIDLESGVLTIVAREGNKIKENQQVYIPKRSLALLKEYATLGLDTKYCFPAIKAEKTPYISYSAIKSAMAYAGINIKEHNIHGWRQVLKTLSAEAGVPSILSEKALSHKVGTQLEQTYNKARYEDALRKFWQWYEDYLFALKNGEELPEWQGERFI